MVQKNMALALALAGALAQAVVEKRRRPPLRAISMGAGAASDQLTQRSSTEREKGIAGLTYAKFIRPAEGATCNRSLLN